MAIEIDSLEAAVERAQALMGQGRKILGLVGKPGSGKSTLAKLLGDRLGAKAQVVSMDGYHLSNKVLLNLGRRQRKGAVDTFDAQGYTLLLERSGAKPICLSITLCSTARSKNPSRQKAWSCLASSW
jgi:pantothenate kinase